MPERSALLGEAAAPFASWLAKRGAYPTLNPMTTKLLAVTRTIPICAPGATMADAGPQARAKILALAVRAHGRSRFDGQGGKALNRSTTTASAADSTSEVNALLNARP